MGMGCIRVAHLGGNANNGSNAGAFYVNSNNTASNANANIGRQLSLLKIAATQFVPCLLAKHKTMPHMCRYGNGRLRGE